MDQVTPPNKTPKPLPVAQVHVESEQLEAAMLNRLLSDTHAPLQVMHLLTDDCFIDPMHHALFRAISELYAAGVEISIVSVTEQLRNTVTPERTADIIYHTADSVFGGREEPLDAGVMALRLLEYAKRRKLSDVAIRINRLLTDMTYNIEEGTAEVQRLFDEILMGSQDSTVSLSEVLDEVRQIADDNQSDLTRHDGIFCGLPDIDQLGGLPRDGLVIVGAKTSHGKTSFAINLAVYALLQGHKIGCFSIEMTKQRVASRIVSMRSGVNSNSLMRLRLPTDQLERTHQTITELQQTVAGNFHFDNRYTHDINGLVMMIRSLHKQRGVDIVVIDYAQLVDASPGQNFENDNKLLAKLSHRLHDVARELGICILLLSQVNRNTPGMPTVSNLRGSGEMEEAADMILLLYNAFQDKAAFPSPFQTYDTRGRLYVEVAKSRDGAKPSFLVGFEPSLTLISPLSQQELVAAPAVTAEQRMIEFFNI